MPLAGHIGQDAGILPRPDLRPLFEELGYLGSVTGLAYESLLHDYHAFTVEVFCFRYVLVQIAVYSNTPFPRRSEAFRKDACSSDVGSRPSSTAGAFRF